MSWSPSLFRICCNLKTVSLQAVHRRRFFSAIFFCVFSQAQLPCVLTRSYRTRQVYNIFQSLRSQRTQDKLQGLWTD